MTQPPHKRYIVRWSTRGQHVDGDAITQAVRVIRHYARMADIDDPINPELAEAGLRGLAYVAEHFVLGKAWRRGRPQATHRDAWLTLYDEVRATKGAKWSRPRIVNAIYRDCRDEHGRPMKAETVRRFIAKHRNKNGTKVFHTEESD